MIALRWLVAGGYIAFLAAVVTIMRAAKGCGRAERAADAGIATRVPAVPPRPTYAPTPAPHLDDAHGRHRADATRSIQ